MLKIANLASGYGRIPILHNVSFDVGEGECIGVWGHNGMGKTTLLATILGYNAVTRGRIEFSGEDITKLPTHIRARKGIGLVPQGRQIFPALTVEENLRMGSAVSGGGRDSGAVSKAQAAARQNGRVAVRRRATAAGSCQMPVRPAQDHDARRADRRHPALD